MIRQSTWIMLVIFVILGGFAWLSQQHQPDNESTATLSPTKFLANIYDVNGTQVDYVDISNTHGAQISYIRDHESNQWSIDTESPDQADSSQTGSNLAQLFDIKAQETLTQTPPLDFIGLVDPAYKVRMTTTEGRNMITRIGSLTPLGNGYYVRVDSGPIFVVEKQELESVLDQLINPTLLETPTPQTTKPTIAFPDNSGFRITSTP